jgi:hypothetical protein
LCGADHSSLSGRRNLEPAAGRPSPITRINRATGRRGPVDTIGLNDKTFVDNYRTPHTTNLHVVERWKMVDDGKMLEVNFRVEDPDTFNEPWSAMRRYRRVQQAMVEEVCAENNQHLFEYHIPVANKPDF